jgi:hypothetical protein
LRSSFGLKKNASDKAVYYEAKKRGVPLVMTLHTFAVYHGNLHRGKYVPEMFKKLINAFNKKPKVLL